MASTAETLSAEDIQGIGFENPDLAEEAIFGNVQREDLTGRSSAKPKAEDTPPAAPAPEATGDPEPAPAQEPARGPALAPAPDSPDPAPAEEPSAPPPAAAAPPVPPSAPPSAQPLPDPVSPPGPSASAPPAVPPPAPTPDPRAAWSPEDRLAAEIKDRNPDLKLEQAIAMARERLGIASPDPNAPPPAPEKSTEELLADVDQKLEEAGKNEGLFTPEIAALTRQQAELTARLAVERADAARQAQADAVAAQAQRDESWGRLVGMLDSSPGNTVAGENGEKTINPESPIGRMMNTVIAEMRSVNHPDLNDPAAPEIVFARANMRLKAEERIEVRKQSAPAASEPAPPPPPSAAPPVPAPPAPPAPAPAPPGPASVLPVAPSARSAQPTAINPAELPQITKEVSVETLEDSIFGKGKGSAPIMAGIPRR